MLRHTENLRLRPDHEGLTRDFLRATLTAVLLLVSPVAFAHAGHHAGTPAAITATPDYVPYLNGAGDPLGLTSSGTIILASAEHHADVPAGNPLARKVRDVNARFADVKAALAEGYAPIPCVSGIEGGAMGIHYVNGDYIADAAVDIGKPEAVMYEPKADGSLELVAVEYITHEGPAALDGQLFSFVGAPNRYGLDPFYELHVWAWRDNPTGTFADMNPNVSCDAAPSAGN
jgi:hypothetical protein